jgi:hypothetical protein
MVFRKPQVVDYVNGINIDFVKSHFVRLDLQANAFKPDTVNRVVSTEQIAYGPSILLPGASPIANPAKWQGRCHIVRALSVGIMKSIFHAPGVIL